MPAVLVDQIQGEAFVFECVRCGSFKIAYTAENRLRKTPLTITQTAVVSGYIRRNPGLTIGPDDLGELRNLRTPRVAEKAASFLLALNNAYPLPGTQIPDIGTVVARLLHWTSICSKDLVYPDEFATNETLSGLQWLAIASAADANELNWLISDVLKTRRLLSEGEPFIFEQLAGTNLIITGEGWAEIDRLTRVNEGSRIGFVAMRFTDEFSDLYSAIDRGIRKAGYEPLRIDRKEHNNRIDDEIIATIKTSRFVVADFTAHRGGIYFEAGYALGMGLKVIWIVRHDRLHDVHFDNRQYNFIVWKDNEWQALTDALNNRIRATIDQGPLTESRR